MPSTTPFAYRLTPDEKATLQQVVKAVTGSDELNTENMRVFITSLKKLIIDKEKPLETVNEKPQRIPDLEIDCHYRAYDPKEDAYYCDVKKVNVFACVNRQKRYLLNGLKCYPAHYGKNYIAQKAPSKLIFDKNLRCTLRDRLIPVSYLPLSECNTCQNTFCKEEIDKMLKSL